MEEVLVKKSNYEVIDRLSSYLLKVKKDDKTYLVYDFSINPEGFGDFKFAYKRLKSSGVTIPTVYELDKKTFRALVEDVEGDTLFDTLCKRDLLDEEIEQVFIANFKARVNRIRLDFDPNILLLDTTSNIVNTATYSNTTIGGTDYINRLTFNIEPVSTMAIKFYKVNPSNNYTYPIVNSSSIVTVTIS